MFDGLKNLPANFSAPEKPSILLISPDTEDEAVLRRIFHDTTVSFLCCGGLAEAIQLIRSGPVSVVICERDLPDGNWRLILAACEALSRPPVLLVTSRHADDRLWAEVLNLGGYDVLAKPFDATEVTRVVDRCSRLAGGAPTSVNRGYGRPSSVPSDAHRQPPQGYA